MFHVIATHALHAAATNNSCPKAASPAPAGYNGYPCPGASDFPWLDTGDNAWQLTAATLVGLMSIPALAVLYAGLVQKKWVVNTMFMCFTAFSGVLIVWVLWAFKMGFGTPAGGGSGYVYGSDFFKNFFSQFVGHPGTSLSHVGEQAQAQIPRLSPPDSTGQPAFRFPQASLVYFQFVFAAITPLLFLGSVLGRIKFKVWLIFVPLWTTFVYAINAMLVWGGGYWGHEGAVDYSGGYVIHLAAGTTGFVAAAMIGPRLARDRERAVPHNLPLVAIGAGILWLGWNGFNGGDPYFASADAATAVLNTNIATACALLAWVILDMFIGKAKKPSFTGSINGMIVGLVAITPAAGYVDGGGAIAVGAIASCIVWFAWNYAPRLSFMQRVDDAMGVVYTHGVAGLSGGLLVGIFADPTVAVYQNTGGTTSAGGGASFSVKGLLYGHPKQLELQALAGLTIIVYDALMTFIILKVISIFTPLRMPDEELEVGDVAVHDEAAYPDDALERMGVGVAAGGGERAPAPGPSASSVDD